MFESIFRIALASALVLSCVGELPHYIKTCSIDDPYFKECFIKHANGAIPYLYKYGSKHFDMLPINPFVVEQLKFNSREDFILELTNMHVHGLDGVKMIDANLDWTTNKLELTFKAPLVNWVTDYKMEGILFDQPINGYGKANFTYMDAISKLKAELNTVEIDGKIHYELSNAISEYKHNNVIYKFENLYDGDEDKSQEMHKLLNEDGTVLWKELKEETDKTIVEFYEMIFNSVFKYATAEEFFKNKVESHSIKKEL